MSGINRIANGAAKTKLPLSRRQRRLNAAKALIAKGIAILPLEVADPKKPGSGKRPITPNGVKDATKDWLTFKSHVAGREDFNIGIATGAINRLLVIDVDPRDGGDETIKELVGKLGKFPPGPKTATGGGGTHRYFKLPKGLDFNGLKLGPGVDIKADNGYVVAPPSRHASGKPYTWVEGCSHLDMKLPELPTPWREAIEAKIKLKPKAVTKDTPAAPAPATSGEPIAEGQRNTTLTSIAGYLRAQGRSVAEVEAELGRVNETRCRPPLDATEVAKIANSSERWGAAPGVGEPGVAERVVRRLLDRDFAGGKHLRFERDQMYYAFDRTHWHPIEASALQRKCLDIIRNEFAEARRRLMSTANEAMALLKVEIGVADDLLHFVEPSPRVINVQNGELWLLDDGQVELKPHAPETGMRHVLAVQYDPAATCPAYGKAIGEIFSKAKYPKTLVKVWHQMSGYIIQPTRPRAVIFVGVGGGGNGKTKLVQTLARLLGRDAIYSGDVARLETSPFGIGGLAGKLLFLDDDVKAGAKLPDGILKKISEGKEITGERKHKDPFNFICGAVPMLLFNNIPSISDLSDGIRRRLIVYKFDRQFLKDEEDSGLFDRIWANELPGVLNRALEGWRQFVANGHKFDPSKDLEAGLRDLLVQGNSLAAFVEECCISYTEGSVEVATLYKNYKQWADESGYKFGIVRNTLKRQFVQMGYRSKMVNGYPCIVGLKLRDRPNGGLQARI